MTQEDKDLILRDLCARLPYNVCINDCGTPHRLVNICWDGIKFVVNCSPFGTGHGRIGTPLFDGDICCIKPYLRPMSSMTDEEKDYVVKHSLGYTANIGGGKKDEKLYFHFKAESFDWLNKNMFDFRGLIPKDLALSTGIYNPYKTSHL